MIKKCILLILFCLNLSCAGFLFITKHRVLILEKSIDCLSGASLKLTEENQILRSELSYLTKPTRVYRLMTKFLPLYKPLCHKQLITLPIGRMSTIK